MGKPRVLILDVANIGARTAASYLKRHLGEEFDVSSHGLSRSGKQKILNADHLISYYWSNRESLFDALKEEMGLEPRQIMAELHFLRFNSAKKLDRDGAHYLRLAERIRKAAAERG